MFLDLHHALGDPQIYIRFCHFETFHDQILGTLNVVNVSPYIALISASDNAHGRGICAHHEDEGNIIEANAIHCSDPDTTFVAHSYHQNDVNDH
jgi:hypothetical protein